MFTFFSIIVILSPIVAVIAAILWAISAVRKKETKAKRILAASAALFVISFIGCAITAPPVDKTASDSQPSATQDMTPEQSQEPTQSLAPETEGNSTTPSPEPTETLEEVTNPLSALDIQEHPVMNGFKTERIGTWAAIITTKEFLSSVTDEQLFQYLNEVAENEYNWINVFFEDGTGLYCLGSMGGYLLEYGNVDRDEGGAVEYIGDMSDSIYTFTGGKYSTEKEPVAEPQPEDSMKPIDTLIEVTLTVSVAGEKGRPEFIINTNLPDETALILTLNGNGNYTAQDKVVVKNGKAVTTAFSDRGAPLTGKYTVDISMSIPSLQSDNVRAIIGEKGENIAGPYVEKSDMFGENAVYCKSIAEYEF